MATPQSKSLDIDLTMQFLPLTNVFESPSSSQFPRYFNNCVHEIHFDTLDGDRRKSVAYNRAMPQVTIAQNALSELRERMAKYRGPMGILIMGPMAEDPRAPGSLEEAWILERLYGPPQRWIFDILPLGMLTRMPRETHEEFHSQEVDGIYVGVLTTQPVRQLRVELHGESIRVFEPGAE